MKQVLLAFQFLTIIPIRIKGEVSGREIARSALFFPVVGAFQGGVAVLASMSMMLFPPEITAALVILTLTIISGGFHLDGLADSVDALALKGSGDEASDRAKRLAIMKEGAIGPMGVIAVVFAILLKFLFVSDLFLKASLPVASSFVFLMPVFSKWAMVPPLYHGVPARHDGLGRTFMDGAGIGTVIISTTLLTLFCLVAHLLYLHGFFRFRALFLLLLLILVLYSLVFSAHFFRKKFGGLTGDHFGAVHEVAEIIFLGVTSLWLRLSI